MSPVIQRFHLERNILYRTVNVGISSGTCAIECPDLKAYACDSDQLLWELLELRGYRPRLLDQPQRLVRIIDLYSGCGGLGHGARRAIEALGHTHQFLGAIDLDEVATSVHAANFAPRYRSNLNIGQLVDYQVAGHGQNARFAYPPELTDKSLQWHLQGADLMIAGPPCQGHSNFNNHSRRTDPRNRLYLTVPAIAVALSVPIVIVENVPQILRDKTEVVATAKGLFANAGYQVQDIVLNAKDFGVAQSRKRHFLIATRAVLRPMREALREVVGAVQPPSVEWAIQDLENVTTDGVFDRPPVASEENKRRMDFLFDNDFYELPNAERPDCHKNGHRYPSIYGRMRSDQPSQTVTTGFISPGCGRFIHPWQRRTITAHEAARLQGFPDYFRFEAPERQPLSRSDYAKLIGDAVPPPLAYYPVLCALAGLS